MQTMLAGLLCCASIPLAVLATIAVRDGIPHWIVSIIVGLLFWFVFFVLFLMHIGGIIDILSLEHGIIRFGPLACDAGIFKFIVVLSWVGSMTAAAEATIAMGDGIPHWSLSIIVCLLLCMLIGSAATAVALSLSELSASQQQQQSEAAPPEDAPVVAPAAALGYKPPTLFPYS